MAKLLAFSDLTKKQEDLLKKEFAYDNLAVLGVQYKRGPDTYKASVTQTTIAPSGTQIGVLATGSAEVKHSTGKVTAEVKSDGKLTYTADYTPEQAQELNLKLELAVTTSGDVQEVDPTVNIGYNLDNANLKFAYNPKTLGANFTVGSPEFGVGLDGKFDTLTQKLASYTFALWSTNSERSVVLKHTGNSAGSFSLQNLSFSYYSLLSKVATFGSAISFDYPKSAGKIAFGGTYKQADDLTLRAKVESSGLVGLALTKNFNQHLDFTLGTELDLNAASKYRFGFKVDLKNE